MAFCTQCGAPNQNSKFCSSCGTPTSAAATNPTKVQPPSVPPPSGISPSRTAGSTPPLPLAQQPLPPVNFALPAQAPKKNNGVWFAVAGAVAVAAIVAVFLLRDVVSEPRIDFSEAQSVLMNPTDFDFDMGRDDDYIRIEERAYPAFRSGEDCEEDVEMARLLDRGEVVASRYLYAGPSLIQFLTFEQAIIQFSTSGPPISALELIRSGHDNPGCEFSGDNLRTRNFGLEDGPEAFEVIGNNSLVHNQDTIFDSLVLDTTVRDVSVWIAQGEFLFVTSAAVDTELDGGVSYRELYRAIEDSVEKAYGD